VAERQIWNGACSSISEYQLQCYGQPVCLSVCLCVCLPAAGMRGRGVCGGLLVRAENKHANTSNYDVESDG